MIGQFLKFITLLFQAFFEFRRTKKLAAEELRLSDLDFLNLTVNAVAKMKELSVKESALAQDIEDMMDEESVDNSGDKN